MCGLPHFYRKLGGYVIIYRRKDKNAIQGSFAELLGSPAHHLGECLNVYWAKVYLYIRLRLEQNLK